MELFIQILNGQPHEHPILGDNFRQAFPSVDVDNLPPEFARFERITFGESGMQAGVFDVPEVSYQWVDGIVKDVWSVRPMTDDERVQKLADLTSSANGQIAWAKQFAQDNADAAPTEEARQAWLGYLTVLNAWVLHDPVNPDIPRPPRVMPDGTVLGTSAPGSAPDVIG